MKKLFVFLFCLIVRTACLDYLDEEVEKQCIENCPLQNRTDKGHYGYACDHNCNIDQCIKGCRLWKLGLTCQETCNGTTERLTPKELYCVMGCNDAMTKYFSQLRLRLGTPPAPALLADSLNATSLKLEWSFPVVKKAGLSCHVQWRYEEFSASTASWQYCRNATWDQHNNIFFVEDLQPYTKYRFRIALLLGHTGHLGEPIVSPESVVISTLASGVPASPPQNDIPPDNNFIMVRDVKPLRNYSIEIRMRNKIGSGPAARAIVSTPAEPQINEVQQPPLILATEYSIFELPHIFSERIILYRSAIKLKGMGFHIHKRLLFVADVEGFVSKIPIEQGTKIDILEPHNQDFKPLDLTVDWLNDQLYILGEVKYQMSRYIIKRCNFDGSSLTVAYAGLSKKPSSIQIDPLNGYLFWTIQDYNKGGLYRLDISDISNGIRHEVEIKRILNETELGAFTFEHHNFNVLVAFQRLNTIMSVTLDGKEMKNIRTLVTTPKLQKVISLATANKKFFWTDGVDVFNEEYHEGSKSYFHNTIPHLTNGFYKKVFVNLQNSQPWPTPINPPTNVQAIFGRDVAKIKWQPPHLVGLQGKGAWQNWSYEICIKDVNSKKIFNYNNINNTFFTTRDLAQNTEYILKVTAYKNSGNKGPWSSEFRGITLNASKSPIILWSAAEGLLKSNATGENVETVISKSKMGSIHFTGITWFRDVIYLVANNSQVFWYNSTTKSQGRLNDMDSVGSIAVDWIGMKMYWSNPKQQLIIRGTLNGTEQEPLLNVLAKELNIDSIKAFLYWSTGTKVECAHLNGVDKFEYHDVHYFSGKQVMGLTLNLEQKFVYWIVRGSEGSKLYKAPMQGYWENEKHKVEIVSSLQKPNIQGPLCYFHRRLLWLQDDKNAAISDLSGKNIATINGKHMHGLNMVYVVDPSLYVLPDDTDPWSQIIVVPDKVNKTSITAIGSFESFNVTWDAVTNVNYGLVFYEIQIDHPLEQNGLAIITTTHPTIKYWREVAPYTALNVTLRAFTYWGSSPQVRMEIFSPSSIPSAPVNLRTFVVYELDRSFEKHLSVVVRWDPPLKPNGLVLGFKMRCWYILEDVQIDICDTVFPAASATEHRFTELRFDEVYYFEIKAFTDVGPGETSETISVDTGDERPVPTLLVATHDSILIDDIDKNRTYPLLEGITTPVAITYLMKDNTVFWINQKRELIMYNVSESLQTKLVDIGGKPTSLTLDWLERSLYYAEIAIERNTSSIHKIDLNRIDKETIASKKIIEVNYVISKINISPFSKTLFWIQTNDKMNYKLMQSYSNGTNIRPFFSDTSHETFSLDGSPCNCPFLSEVGPSLTLDHSHSKIKPLVIFLDIYSLNLISADKEACLCNVLTNNSITKKHFPVDQIKADFEMLYWTSQHLLYALRIKDDSILTKKLNVSDIIIYGQHMQPYPAKKCLSPMQHNYTVSLNSRTWNSLNLEMPQEFIYEECANMSMATVRYTVFYCRYGESDCSSVTTSNKTKELTGLKPFTNYLVSVSVSNYFSNRDVVLDGLSWKEFRTAPGVPSKPQNVSAMVLSPTLVEVSWVAPAELNGIIVYYEIHWQTESMPSGVRQKGELTVDDSKVLSTFLNKLSPNETYTVWVRVYSESNETSNESDRVKITTYPEPSSLILVNKTANTMKISWELTQHIDTYTVEYAPITVNEWKNIDDLQRKNDTIIIKVKSLNPKTHYKFRLALLYEGNDEQYIWPVDSRFTFETLGDRPSPPGIPIIQYVKPNVYKVFWEASKDNGAPIELYKLEGKILRYYRNRRSTNRTVPYYNTSPSIELDDLENWKTFYNGTNTSWIIDGLNEKHKYAFRVSALNSYGWSNTSEESNEFDLNEAARMAGKEGPMKLVLIATGVPISICFLVVLGFSYVICSGKGKQKKLQVVTIPRAPDVELATLRELPRRGTHNTNILYVSALPTPEELTLLPQIRRDQITLNKFLGSGAFGEVFEGKAKGIGSNIIETKVAVKTLKKGASEQEKSEFLQEAQLMSHFKHEHILQLLGVCLDNDPHFIIMELMEGGDLLTYLRDSRNTLTNTPSLNLIELLKMCVDVSKGCRYLEEMHFVHRDLACRNCLVSSFETESRIVKIGDFGLARDIYKNDYYRKEGEGLLPVRWMAPESLVDGVFTSQSDVWAFGVLLWEIMTLGQQPYPARANLEVLHYVRGGGRLGKPTDCPEDLHKLMLKCWEFDPEKRPTFKYCLEVLENLHRSTLRNPCTGAHEGQYISTIPERNSWKSDSEDEANKEKTPFLQPDKNTAIKEIPKYLELVYEPEPPLENDGYEIPIQTVPKKITSNGISTCRKSSSNSITSAVVITKNEDIADLAIQ